MATLLHHGEVPLLETERLRLCAHRIDHFTEATSMWAHPEVVRHISGKPSPQQRTWERLLIYRGHWVLLGYGYWAVEEKSTGLYIGEVGFADFKRDLDVSLRGIPELGWALAPHAHGKGYATEALLAAIKWGDDNLNSNRTVCIIKPENAASLRVAQKCSYVECLRTLKHGDAAVVMERFR